MNKIFIVCLISLMLLANCKKKEEQKVQKPFSAGPIYGQGEIVQLQDLVRQNPKNISAWIQLGNMFMDTQRYQEAIDAYQKALELEPNNVDVRVDMGTCYRGIIRSDRAVEEYRKAIEINPHHLNAHRNLGIVLGFDLGYKEEAIKELQEYLRLSPYAPDADRIRQAISRLKD